MEVDVDIGTIPISEWKDLVRQFLFRYRNKKCQCRMLDIAIKAYVDAHLCFPMPKLLIIPFYQSYNLPHR
jgi:hypothetical protein